MMTPAPPGTLIEIHASAQVPGGITSKASIQIVVVKTWGAGRTFQRVGGGVDPLMAGLRVRRGDVTGIQLTDGRLW
jgi:hypothetical protein